MNMYNYFLKARVSLRTLSSLVINLFTQVAIVLELAPVPHSYALDYLGHILKRSFEAIHSASR